VYTALHLNVPQQGTSKTRLLMRKLKWALIGILAPEVVLFNAWTQWRDAKKLSASVKAKVNYVRIRT
jgi:hypothetical protein